MKIILYNLVLGYLTLMNLIGFMMMGIDKQKAIKKGWRISERTLLLVAIVGGGIGSFLGMRIFHHKTKHTKFKIVLPLTAIFYVFIIICILKVQV